MQAVYQSRDPCNVMIVKELFAAVWPCWRETLTNPRVDSSSSPSG